MVPAQAATKRGMGIVAERDKLSWTTLDGDLGGTVVVAEEVDSPIPASHRARGAQLEWMLEESCNLINRLNPDRIVLQKGGEGSARERVQAEGMVELAAHRTGATFKLLTRDGVRARLGVERGQGAFDTLLASPDVAERSNAKKRERYLFAKAALAL